MRYVINYRLSVDNGTLVDEAENFEFEAGDAQLAYELEKCITESVTDELQTFLLSGTDVFGVCDGNAVTKVDVSTLPPNYKINSAIDFDLTNGEKVIGVVKEIEDTTAVIDFNHPLSSCNLAFSFEILSRQ